MTPDLSSWELADEVPNQTLRDLLMDCWQEDPKQRPKASKCCEALRYMVRGKLFISTFPGPIVTLHFV